LTRVGTALGSVGGHPARHEYGDRNRDDYLPSPAPSVSETRMGHDSTSSGDE
jgi:hypothetical protein